MNKNGDLTCHEAGDACMNYTVLSYINSHDVAKLNGEIAIIFDYGYSCVEIPAIFQIDKIPKSFISI